MSSDRESEKELYLMYKKKSKFWHLRSDISSGTAKKKRKRDSRSASLRATSATEKKFKIEIIEFFLL